MNVNEPVQVKCGATKAGWDKPVVRVNNTSVRYDGAKDSAKLKQVKEARSELDA